MALANFHKPIKGKCRVCGKDIVWAKTQTKSGQYKSLPFDILASESGTYALVHPKGDKTRLVAFYRPPGSDWPLYSLPRQLHFRSCKPAT